MSKPLYIESLEDTLKQVTFDMKHLTLWPGVDIWENYEVIDLHGKLKVGSIRYDDAASIFAMFQALANTRIIADAAHTGGERMYIDSRPHQRG